MSKVQQEIIILVIPKCIKQMKNLNSRNNKLDIIALNLSS